MRRLLLAACLLLPLAAAVAPPAAAQTLKPKPAPRLKTISQTLVLIPSASTFYAGLKAARLDSVLNGPAQAQYTVFVPSNEAFERLKEKGLGLASITGQGLDPRQQEQLIRFHVIPGRYPTEALKAGLALRSLHPAFAVKVSAQGPKVFVRGTNTAPVELANAYILCENGVIHLIDDVLIPFTRAREAAPAAGK